MKMDLAKIRQLAHTSADLKTYIEDELNRCAADGDVPFLSDLITDPGAGVHVMMALQNRFDTDRNVPLEQRFRWLIQVVRDEWGNPPQPGDIVYRRIQKPLKYSPTKMVPANDLSVDIIQGLYHRKWSIFVPYEVDERGCITCEFQDASFFLMNFGIHPVSRRGGPPLSRHLREHTEEPADVRDHEGNLIHKDGKPQKLHAWYWRYMEMDRESYAALPKIKKSSEPRRGAAVNA